MNNCNWFKERVFDYIDGLLPNENKKTLERHFTRCPVCLGAYQDAKNVKLQLRNLKPLKTSPDFETVLRTRISMERSLNRRNTLSWPVRIPIYAASGAIIALAAFFVLSSLNMQFRTNDSKSSALLTSPGYTTNPNLPDYYGLGYQNQSLNVKYPMDPIPYSGRGTSINSKELEKYSASKFDSSRGINAKTVTHTFEF